MSGDLKKGIETKTVLLVLLVLNKLNPLREAINGFEISRKKASVLLLYLRHHNP